MVLACCCFGMLTPTLQAQFQSNYSYPGIDNDHFSIAESPAFAGEYTIAGTHYDGPQESIQVTHIDNLGAVLWEHNYSSGGNDRAFHIEALTSGEYAITGITQGAAGNEALFMLLDPSGAIIQQRSYSIQGFQHVNGLHVIQTTADPVPGFVIAGFGCDLFDPAAPKTGFLLKIDGSLNVQWVSLFDSSGTFNVDWDMASHVLEVPGHGYFVSGSANGDSYQEAAALLYDVAGGLVWQHKYTDNSGGGHYSVGASAVYDGDKIYQLANHSIIHHFGVMPFDPATGTPDIPNAWEAFSNLGYYNIQGFKLMESINSNNLVVAGYMRDHFWTEFDDVTSTTTSYSGSVPFMMEVDKNGTSILWDELYQVPSPGYSTSTDIFSAFSAGQQPRILHPEMALRKLDNMGYVLDAYRKDANPNFDLELIETDAMGRNQCSSEPADLIFATPNWFFENGITSYLGAGFQNISSLNLGVRNAQVGSCDGCDINGDYSYAVNAADCSVDFSALVSGSDCYDWDFGDGTSASGPSVNHVFPGSGNYTVCLTLCCTNPDGTVTSNVICKDIVVDCGCDITPDFNFDVDGCTVSFFDLSMPAGASGCYDWDFGDGTTDTSGNPTPVHTYSGAGTYTVCLTVCCINPDGTVTYETICREVTVDGCCDVVPGWNEEIQGCTYTWTAQNLGTTPMSDVCFEWVLPDGTTSNSTTVSYTFEDCGFYDLQLSIWCCNDPSTILTVVATLFIEDCCCDVMPDFTWDPISCTVNFNAINLGADPTACYEWDFGDGNSASGIPNPTHTYASSGTYTVCLTMCCERADGTIEYFTVCQDIVVECGCDMPGPFQLKSYPLMDDTQCGTMFCIAPVPDPDQYCIEVFPGDGSSFFLTDPSGCVDIFYDCGGTYEICANIFCCDDPTVSWSDCIVVDIECPCIAPEFVDVAVLSNVDCTVELEAFLPVPPCPGTDYCYDWNFGDGSPIVSGINPVSHTYSASGAYTVCVDVYCCDNPDVVVTRCIDVVVDCPCDQPDPFQLSSYPLDPAIGCGTTICIAPMPDLSEYCIEVLPGDGTAIPLTDPSGCIDLVYDCSGVYDICVNVFCCDDPSVVQTHCIAVDVVCPCEPPLFADIDVISNVDCTVDVQALFPISSCPDDQYCTMWDFGDGSAPVTNVNSLSHTYSASGTYTICLTVFCCDDPNLSITVCRDVVVDCPCDVPDVIIESFSLTSNGLCEYGFCVIPLTPITDPSQYCVTWDFGDGTVEMHPFDVCPVHIYECDGIYDVCVTVACCDDPDSGVTYCNAVEVDCPCNLSADADFNVTQTSDPINGVCETTVDILLPITVCPDEICWTWDMGDGSAPITGNVPSVTHVYPADGSYTICLNVFCCDDPTIGYVICKDIVVDCNDCPEPCELFPMFQTDINECTVQFVNLSASGSFTTITSYFWDFGDGNTSTLSNPTHSYATEGVHTVCLTITGSSPDGNCTETFCWDVSCEFFCPGDINDDGVVNFADLLIILGSYGQNCP